MTKKYQIIIIFIISYIVSACNFFGNTPENRTIQSGAESNKTVIELTERPIPTLLSAFRINDMLIPTGLEQFNCLGINVTAPDIGAFNGCNNEIRLGQVVGFSPRSSRIEIDVPTGRNRTFQVLGFANATSCPHIMHLANMAPGTIPGGTTGPGYILGTKQVDILSPLATVNIPVSFQLGVNQTFCGSPPSATTNITHGKVFPGAGADPVITSGSSTSSTAAACVAYATTANSPQFTCYLNGSAVACSPGACTVPNGGYAQYIGPAPLADGARVLRIETTDSIFNKRANDITFTFTVDTTAPTISVTAINTGTYDAGTTRWYTRVATPTVTLTVSEAGTVAYSTDGGGTYTSCATPTTSGTTGCQIALSAGLNNLTFRLTDAAGNINTTTADYSYDATPPTITLTPAAGLISSSTFWSFGGDLTSIATVAAADAVLLDTTNVSCSLNSGADYDCNATPIVDASATNSGNRHTLTVRAKDAASNQTYSAFTIFTDSLYNRPVIGRRLSDGTSLIDETNYTNSLTPTLTNPVGFNGPGQTAYDASLGVLFVADVSNHRVLVFQYNAETGRFNSRKAVAVYGQATLASNFNGTNDTTMNGVTYTPMDGPTGVAVSASPHRLFVADTNNNRVLRFDLSNADFSDASSITYDREADLVLGQATLATNTAGDETIGTAGALLASPISLAFDDTNNRLFVADQGTCRVAIFDDPNSNGAVSGASIDYQLAASNTAPNGIWSCAAAAANNTLNSPIGIHYNITLDRLYISDSIFRRVLYFDNAGTIATNVNSADGVIGQADFVTTTNDDNNGASAPNLSSPQGVTSFTAASDDYVVISDSNKIKFYKDNAGTFEQVATLNSLGTSGVTQSLLSNPSHLVAYTSSIDAYTRLLVTDAANHRVLQYEFNLPSGAMLPNEVIGHTDAAGQTRSFYAGSANSPNGTSLNSAQHIAFDSSRNRLFVSDTNHHRILVYRVNPADKKPQTEAYFQIGYKTLAPDHDALLDASTTANTTTSFSLNTPTGITLDSSGNLYVSDAGNHRILKFPTGVTTLSETSKIATLVLGQSDYVSNSSGAGLTNLNTPSGLAIDTNDNYLYVADNGNNRLIYYDLDTATDGATATLALSNGSSQTTVSAPTALFYTSGNDYVNRGLFVADTGNHRVNYYDLTGGVPASSTFCYGHRDATVAAACNNVLANDGAGAPQSFAFDSPNAIFFDTNNSNLYVSDSNNRRVLAFDLSDADNQPSLGPSNAFDAYHAIGAVDMTTAGAPGAVPTHNAVGSPVGILVLSHPTSGRLIYLMDALFHRIGVYDAP